MIDNDESILNAKTLTETQKLRTIYCHGQGMKNYLLPNRLTKMKIERTTLWSISVWITSS